MWKGKERAEAQKLKQSYERESREGRERRDKRRGEGIHTFTFVFPV